MNAPENCPNCGADVPRGARACSECGADEKTGWSEEADTPGNLGIPEESFDYEDFMQREFGGGHAAVEKRERFWRLVGIIVLVSFLLPIGYFVLAAFLRSGSR